MLNLPDTTSSQKSMAGKKGKITPATLADEVVTWVPLLKATSWKSVICVYPESLCICSDVNDIYNPSFLLRLLSVIEDALEPY